MHHFRNVRCCGGKGYITMASNMRVIMNQIWFPKLWSYIFLFIKLNMNIINVIALPYVLSRVCFWKGRGSRPMNQVCRTSGNNWNASA
jgi:hypothetical protein